MKKKIKLKGNMSYPDKHNIENQITSNKLDILNGWKLENRNEDRGFTENMFKKYAKIVFDKEFEELSIDESKTVLKEILSAHIIIDIDYALHTIMKIPHPDDY